MLNFESKVHVIKLYHLKKIPLDFNHLNITYFGLKHLLELDTLQISTTKLLRNYNKNVLVWILLLRIVVYYRLLYF